jgi:hypothetical protein
LFAQPETGERVDTTDVFEFVGEFVGEIVGEIVKDGSL